MVAMKGAVCTPEKLDARSKQAAELWSEIGTVAGVASALGISRSTARRALRDAGVDLHADPKARSRGPRVFLLTAAQDSTPHHDGFWQNLLAYAKHRKAEILVGGFTYQKGLFEDHNVVRNVFDRTIAPYLVPEKRELAPGLIWCGHANILPTAARPVSGWDTLTGPEAWGIIPHAKIQLLSVPVMPGDPPKQIITTGVVTHPNYVARNAGQKAEFHHTIGAAVVELGTDGRFWVRQLAASGGGSFQDLDTLVTDGQVSTGHRVEAITWGDIHHEQLDPQVAAHSFGIGDDAPKTSMLDALRPRHQFFHDLIDFRRRNHHNRDDAQFRTRIHSEGENVEDEIAGCVEFLRRTQREWAQSVVIESNHDTALAKWLKDTTAAGDSENAYYWHRLNADWHDAIRAGKAETFNIVEHALRAADDLGLPDITFVPEGQSYRICQSSSAPIECGLHGHYGANGSRGSLTGMARIAPKVNIAHSHTPGILEGSYQTGVSGRLDMIYNTRGPTAWTHAHIITYPTGKRTIVTLRDGLWRA